jgi:hypothetical protein
MYSFTQSSFYASPSIMLSFTSVSCLFFNVPISQNNKCIFWLKNFYLDMASSLRWSKSGPRWQGNTKMNMKETGYEVVNWKLRVHNNIKFYHLKNHQLLKEYPAKYCQLWGINNFGVWEIVIILIYIRYIHFTSLSRDEKSKGSYLISL